MKPWLKRALLGVVVVAAGASAILAWRLRPRESFFLTDGGVIREPVATATLREILWEPPVPLDGPINLPVDVFEPCISADGMTLYFVRGRAGRNADLFVCRKTLRGWTKPAPIEAINSESDELGPHPSPDGRTLYFYSDRRGGLGGFDLWMSQHTDEGWSAPVNLGPTVNSEFNEYGPAPSPDGRTLYFASNRPRPNERIAPQAGRWSATIREDLTHHDYDLYQAPIEDGGVGESIALVALNTPANEGAPCISPFGDFLYFGSDRAGGRGGFDLYRARRGATGFEQASNLGSAVNTSSNELDPSLAMGGFGLYFSSDRAGEASGKGKPGEYQLYYTSSREVFRDRVVFRPAVNWREVWRRLAPNLFWGLLSLFALLLILAGLRDVRRRQFGLLTRCLLFSLLIHLLLMLGFNAWRVGTTIAQEIGRKGPIQVVLGGSSVDAIAGQVRGQLTHVDSPMPSVAPVSRVAIDVEPPPPTEAAITAPPKVEVPDAAGSRTAIRVQDAPSTPVRVATRSDARLAPTPQLLPEISVPREESPSSGTEPDRPSVAPKLAIRTERVPTIQTTQPAPRVDLPPAQGPPTSDQTLALRSSLRDAVPRSGAVHLVSPAETVQLSALVPDVAIPNDVVGPSATSEGAPAPKPVAMASAHARDDRPTEAPHSVILGQAVPGDRAGNGSFGSIAPSVSGREVEASPQHGTSAAGGLPSSFGLAPIVAAPPMEGNPHGAGGNAEVGLATGKPAPLGRTAFAEAGSSGAPDGSIVSTTPPSGGGLAADTSLVRSDAQDAGIGSARSTGPIAAAFTTGASGVPDGVGLSLRVPTEQLAPENPYIQREPEQRDDLVRRMGGSDRTEAAVKRSLKWLAAHQSADGRWSSTAFDRDCGDCEGGAQIEADVAMTGLAVLCFLGADHSHMKDGPYRDNVGRAIRWLRKIQDSDGDLRNGESMYSHGIASIALAEAYGMTRDEELVVPVQRAADFIWRARNRRGAGWRYEPGQFGDTSVLGWQIMALRSAQRAGIDVPDAAFETAQRWLERVSTRSRPGLYAYQPGRAVTPSMTAEGMFVLQIAGVARDDARMDAAAALIIRNRPDWDGGANTYYWYYATLALFQRQGEEWPRWNRRLVRELLAHQNTKGAAAGSWNPEGEWAPAAGRVYQTAICTLMLEVYYRYLPMYGASGPTTQSGGG